MTTIADLQMPDTDTDTDTDTGNDDESVDFSSMSPYRDRLDFADDAIAEGDLATAWLIAGAVFAALLVLFSVLWVVMTRTSHAPWAAPVGPILAAGFAWFAFPTLRDCWYDHRTQMRATIAFGTEWRSPQEELGRAVNLGDAALVRRVLSTPAADVNHHYGSAEPSLLHRKTWTLCSHMHEQEDKKKALDTIRALLEYGARCGVKNYAGETPLDLARDACTSNNGRDRVPAELIVLLQDASEVEERTAIVEASEARMRGKDVWHRRLLERRTETFALAPAARGDALIYHFDDNGGHDDDGIKALLNTFDSTGRTALHWAARAENLALVRWLARHGAEVHQRWNGQYDHRDADGAPVDAEGYVLDLNTPFEFAHDDDEKLDALTEAFEAGLRERESDQLRYSIVTLNETLPTRARKRL